MQCNEQGMATTVRIVAVSVFMLYLGRELVSRPISMRRDENCYSYVGRNRALLGGDAMMLGDAPANSSRCRFPSFATITAL